VCRFPFRHARRDFGVVLGQLPELAKHVLLRRTRRFGDERRGTEELARRIASPLDLQDPPHLPVVGDGERDEHDHPSRQNAAEGEKVWAHVYNLRDVRVQRKPFRAMTDCVAAGER
jgi:hypothetical protein